MGTNAVDHHTVSEETLIELCRSSSAQLVSNPELNGRKVVKISDRAVIKYGMGVTRREADTQDYVSRHAKGSTLLRVPEVYRFFTSLYGDYNYEYGYLVMEYIPGLCLDVIDLNQHPHVLERIASSLRYLWQIPVPHDEQAPGPLDGGRPKGYVFGDGGCDVAFNTISEMNNWMDDRLVLQKMRLDIIPQARIPGREMLKDYKRGSEYHWSKVVMCHLDVAPRNLLLLCDGSICLLDWAFAGFYPSIFEVYTLHARAEWDRKDLKTLLGHIYTADARLARQMQILSAVHYTNDSVTL